MTNFLDFFSNAEHWLVAAVAAVVAWIVAALHKASTTVKSVSAANAPTVE